MISVLFGVALLLFAVFACLPSGMFGLGWGGNVLLVLKGASPVLALVVGVFSLLVGFADIRDKREAKKDEEAAVRAEEEARAKKPRSADAQERA